MNYNDQQLKGKVSVSIILGQQTKLAVLINLLGLAHGAQRIIFGCGCYDFQFSVKQSCSMPERLIGPKSRESLY